jgi:beta-glucanase (GH16 family)
MENIGREPSVVHCSMHGLGYSGGGSLSAAFTLPGGAGQAWVFDHPFFVLLNVAVGGDWPGRPDATTVLPQTMLVDYVHVYR